MTTFKQDFLDALGLVLGLLLIFFVLPMVIGG